MKKAVYIAAGAMVFVALLLYLTLGHRDFKVEVCMQFQGRQACRVASGASEKAALQAAISNACTLIASGMTDSIACERTAPASVRWLEGR